MLTYLALVSHLNKVWSVILQGTPQLFPFCMPYGKMWTTGYSLLKFFCLLLLFSASVPEIEHEITIPDQPESMMPMIRKKESDFMGMFEYRRDQEQQILRSLIYGKQSKKINKVGMLEQDKKGR